MDLCSAAWSTASSPPSLTSGAAGLFTTLFFLTVHHFYGIFPLNTLSKRHQQLPRGLSRARLRVLRSRPGLPSRRAPLSAMLHRHPGRRDTVQRALGAPSGIQGRETCTAEEWRKFSGFPWWWVPVFPAHRRAFFFQEFSEIFVIPYSSSKLKLNSP